MERLIDGKQDDSWARRLEGGGTEQNGKHLMDMDNSVVIARGRGA